MIRVYKGERYLILKYCVLLAYALEKKMSETLQRRIILMIVLAYEVQCVNISEHASKKLGQL
jgi:hypothetical protein